MFLNAILILFSFISVIMAEELMIFTTLGSNDNSVRELIGSIHDYSHKIKVKVFGYDNSHNYGIIDEITLWKRVQFINISRELEFQSAGSVNNNNGHRITKDFDEYSKYCMFEYLFEEEGADRVIFIENGLIFKKDIMEIDDCIGDGFEIHSKPSIYLRNALKSYRNGNDVNPFLKRTEFKLPKMGKEPKWFCSINVRRELIFSSLLERNASRRKSESNGEGKVALLVPARNMKLGDAKESALMKYLIDSLESEKGFEITLYVGYDWDDVILSKIESRRMIEEELRLKGIFCEFVEFPRTGWLTFIWNALFVRAFADGNVYFVQLNDDVRFERSGWLAGSIDLMKRESLQVVGFNDSLWKCKLFTQSLVSRQHYIAFEGEYFPLILANWYSDNWISSIYGTKGRCNEKAEISNSHIPTRYKKCNIKNN